MTSRTTPSAYCTKRCGAATASSCVPPMPPPAGRRRARRRPRWVLGQHPGRARRRAFGRDQTRSCRHAAARRLGQHDHRHWPAHRTRACRCHRRRDRRAILAFFDAIAPIIHADSIDTAKTWRQSRYDKGDGADYINCGFDKEQYEQFVASCSPRPTRSRSTNGKRTRPISTAACRSKSWRRAGMTPCAGDR